MNILNDDFGCYYMGFSVMKLNIIVHNKSFISVFNDDTATMLHEYIHYLQDITTVRGLSTIITLFQKLQLVSSHLDTKFLIPIQSSQVYKIDKNAAFNDEILTLEKGDTHINKTRISHINDVICETENMEMLLELYSDVAHPSAKGYQNIEIYYDDLNEPYKFGSDCIAESMAYLAERILCNSFERKNELPYNACELLCKFKFPELKISPVILLAICELSLMEENSGELFYFLLNDIAERKLSFNCVEEFEKIYIGIFNDLCKKMICKNYKVSECIDFLYPIDINKPQLNMRAVNKKMKERINNGLIYRIIGGLFISKAIEKNDIQAINVMFKKLGVPLIIDKNKELFTDFDCNIGTESESISIPLLMPLAVFNSLFSSNPIERNCFLYEYCKKQEMNIKNEWNCKWAPWKQAIERELCPYAMYIFMKGINPNNIIPKCDK